MALLTRKTRSWLTPALLLFPPVALFLAVIVFTSFQSVWISFHRYDGFGDLTWIGLGNYEELLQDPQFFVSLRNNVIWLVLFMLAPPLGLAVALLVNQKIRGMRIAKSLFFVPLVLAPVAVGVVFSWVYTPQIGLLSKVFSLFGAEAPALLSDERWVTFAVVGAALWPQIAFCMVLYLAGLNNLSEDLIAAGRVDGAKGATMLWHIVLPQLTQVSFIAVAITAIGALRSFDMISVMTAGGPFGSSSTLAYQMYEQSIFSYRFGYGAAIATVLFAIMSVFIAWYLSRVTRNDARSS
ncbi:sugar ABC transporter permease [Halocynthiibacter sp. C4]|uniref:carbohydrate ABC transporter permease n=1 Tax=Halocynthiibacter sp. C4 TaxID=2992758 RepID=UPI00237B7A0D|nr:sugar ABC transporter permease [Halocynthiibacter sp. C4]MDE0589688.1 sugar ABC transporter permease [Halocynthiibacter sp. C4]